MIKSYAKVTQIFVVLAGVLGGMIWWQRSKHSPSKVYTIGILQTASHPALDAAREGFVSYLKEALPNQIEFITKNVQGDVAQAYSVAKSFNQSPAINGLFAIATLTAQAAVQTQTDKPIAIAAVTDPVEHGIWKPGGLVCGASDRVDIYKQIELMHLLFPSLARVGLLFTLSEPNSVSLVDEMKRALEEEQIEVVEFGIATASDLPLIVARIKEVDLVWVPTDNGVATALDMVTKSLQQANIPLIVSFDISPGVFAAAGIDYKKSGVQAAQCLEKVLIQGQKPSDIPILHPLIDYFVVNKKMAEERGIVERLSESKSIIWF